MEIFVDLFEFSNIVCYQYSNSLLKGNFLRSLLILSINDASRNLTTLLMETVT